MMSRYTKGSAEAANGKTTEAAKLQAGEHLNTHDDGETLHFFARKERLGGVSREI